MRKVCHQFNRVNPVLNTAANSIMLGRPKWEKIIKKSSAKGVHGLYKTIVRIQNCFSV